ncbi:AlpA family phage regulatory protein [Sphingosinithalassobacter tenebrarum]|uniref:AlpA family phage regulatory protein n=2 Tax=Stakelama tenebrarum TaxID=2711215 RepID=A0A6G6YAB5_9SPHN|nr:AlpA family phage regulatory protein [Sphingosinithalassobacter tenebrarum]
MRDLASRRDRHGNLVRTGETGLSKSTIYNMIQEGEFPRPVQLGKQAVGWRQADIERWKSERAEAR